MIYDINRPEIILMAMPQFPNKAIIAGKQDPNTDKIKLNPFK